MSVNGVTSDGIHNKAPNAETQNKLDVQAYAAQVQAKYNSERDKRIRHDFEDQFVKLHSSEQYKHFSEDPWLPADGAVPGIQLQEGEQHRFKFVIQGAGYGGLLYGAHLVAAGYNPHDFAFIDYAGGFGGTWYWNRYPGLMCDVASELYMPLLEETEYIPKHKYSYGHELREHAERIARKYNLQDQGIFRSTISSAVWNTDQNAWEVSIVQEQGARQGFEAAKVKTTVIGDYFVLMGGILNYPKLPRLPGIDKFQGYQFHTSRWDYQYTGGSQENPDLVNLRDKTVALIGTGSSGVQILPELARCAKHVYIIQRTPASVDVRGQSTIDPEQWKKSHLEAGWQRYNRNIFASYIANEPDKPATCPVDDAWSHMPSYKALIGGHNTVNPMQPETIAGYIKSLHMMDFPRQERIRARVDEVVRDADTAQRLKAWYPGWCKRPCFHDDFLPSFNKSNVDLVDTEGRGIDSLTQDGVVVAGREFKVDVLIWGTGYSVNVTASPDQRGAITVQGRHGKAMSEKWKDGPASLYGITTRDFPNFFYPLSQIAATANNVHTIEFMAESTAYLIKEAESRYPGKKILIEPTHEAEEAWAMRIAGGAAAFAGLVGCTPSYLNGEGLSDHRMKGMSPEQKANGARGAMWGQGFLDFQRIVSEWREAGKLEGVDITVVS